MIFSSIFPSLVSFFYPSQKSFENVKEDLFTIDLDAEIKTYREIFSKATLDKNFDGFLKFTYTNQNKQIESFLFTNEKKLDEFLSQKEKVVTLWKIQDKRDLSIKTIYKYYDDIEEKELTFFNKNELYKEISSTTEHGIFCIYDVETQKEIFIQQIKGWFQSSFIKISSDQAKQIVIQGNISKTSRNKVYAFGITLLSLTPAMIGVATVFVKNFQNLTNNYPRGNDALINIFKKSLSIVDSKSLTFELMALNLVFQTSKHRSITKGIVLAELIAGLLAQSKFVKSSQLCPELIGSYNTPGFAYGIKVIGDHAYVASYSSGFHNVNIANKTNPTLIGSYDTLGQAWGIDVLSNFVFIADWTAGLKILDITNATNPKLIGTYNTPHIAYSVATTGNFTFVADNNSGLQIIDTRNKSNPVFASSYNTPGRTVGVFIRNNFAFCRDTVLGLFILNISNPFSPQLVSTYNTTGSSWGIAIDTDYAYVPDDLGLQILNISILENPRLVGSYNFSVGTFRIALFNNIIFMAQGYSGVTLMNVSNVTNPTFVGSYNTNGRVLDVAALGDYIYLADDGPGIKIIKKNASCTTSSSSFSTLSSSLSSTTTTTQISNNTVTSDITNSKTTSNTNSITTSNDLASSSLHVVRNVSLGIISAIICFGATGFSVYYLLKKRTKPSDFESNNTPRNISRSSDILDENQYQMASDVATPIEEQYGRTPSDVFANSYGKTPVF